MIDHLKLLRVNDKIVKVEDMLAPLNLTLKKSGTSSFDVVKFGAGNDSFHAVRPNRTRRKR